MIVKVEKGVADGMLPAFHAVRLRPIFVPWSKRRMLTILADERAVLAEALAARGPPRPRASLVAGGRRHRGRSSYIVPGQGLRRRRRYFQCLGALLEIERNALELAILLRCPAEGRGGGSRYF